MSAERRKPIDCESVTQLARKLRDGEFRSSFAESPGEALYSAGLQEGLPSEFVDAVSQLSPDELGRIADIVALLDTFEVRGKQPSPCWF